MLGAVMNGAKPWRILLVENDEDDCVLTRSLFSAGSQDVELEWVTSLDPAIARLLGGPAFDAVLADYWLGARTGIDLVREAAELGVRTPVILLTNQGSHEIDLAAMEAGAADYLVKRDLTPPLLERTVRYAIDARRRDAALREREEQLRQAQKMETIGQLAGGIAHDFNNLLTVISGYGELLLMRLEEGDPGRLDCEEMLRAARRAGELTGRLLAFSRRQVMQPRPVNVNDQVTEILRLLRRLIGPNVELVTDLAAERPIAIVDPGQLEQVLINLAVNARDAMPRGGRLAISTAIREIGAPPAADSRLPAGRYVEIAVEDNGTGMAPEVASHIFEPFFTTKRAGEGTGLGLATVYGIVEQSGGAIAVASAEGEGSRFTVLLPAVGSSDGTSAEPRREAMATPHRNATVLVVEDEAEVRRLVETVLTRAGYRVFTAVDAETAAAYAETLCADLLLTDVTLPGKSGRELAAELCAGNPGLSVLFMSGHPGNAGIGNARLGPEQVLLAKPFVPEELLRCVRAALGPEPS